MEPWAIGIVGGDGNDGGLAASLIDHRDRYREPKAGVLVMLGKNVRLDVVAMGAEAEPRTVRSDGGDAKRKLHPSVRTGLKDLAETRSEVEHNHLLLLPGYNGGG